MLGTTCAVALAKSLVAPNESDTWCQTGGVTPSLAEAPDSRPAIMGWIVPYTGRPVGCSTECANGWFIFVWRKKKLRVAGPRLQNFLEGKKKASRKSEILACGFDANRVSVGVAGHQMRNADREKVEAASRSQALLAGSVLRCTRTGGGMRVKIPRIRSCGNNPVHASLLQKSMRSK